MSCVLVVEDERGIADPLRQILEREGYDVLLAETMRQARTHGPAADLIVLDWMLPDGQGIDLLASWRREGIDTPVIVLTARDELIDKVLGLEIGADDYMTKPFEARELLARIKARLRRDVRREAAPTIGASGIVMNLHARSVSFGGADVVLTKMEFALLHVFLQSPGRVFTRDELLDRVWGYDGFPTTRTVDTHVLQLRNKLSADLFETVRGVGYRLRAET